MRAMFHDWPGLALKSFYWLFVLYLFLPLSLMVAVSFKDASFISASVFCGRSAS